jgi:integrase/recombinase XerD
MIVLRPLWHREQFCVTISGDLTGKALQAIRKFPDRKFSITHRCWYIVYQEAKLQELKVLLETCGPVVLEGDFNHENPSDIPISDTKELGPEVPGEFVETLRRMRYSEATIVGYVIQFKKFLSFILPRTCEEIDSIMIHNYLLYLTETRKVSISTQNQAINSIKFYLEHVLGGERKVYYLERPRKEWRCQRFSAKMRLRHYSMQPKTSSTGLSCSCYTRPVCA